MPELSVSPAILLPQVSRADEMDSALPLEHTSVSVQITGPVASVVVSQRFGNPLKEPAEMDYLFPLPAEAAITGFELQVGQRRIQSDLQEREAARAAYDEARGQGKRAGLFEQRRPNLFAVRLANVQVGENVQATVRYQQRLKFEDGSYEFVFPMGITPKYDSPQHPGEGEGVHAPVAHAEEKIGPVELSLAVDAGLSVADPASPSHSLEITRLDERRFQARLAGEQIPDHDFVLRYRLAGEQLQAAGWSSGEAGKAFFLATLVPPTTEEDAQPLPREFIFVLDRSGSMSGEPIQQARNALRACLRALNPEDTFRILLFDNQIEWFQPEPAPAAQEQVERADAYLNGIQGRGGTEIVGALEAVLSLPADPKRARFIVFLTDGAVSAEARVLDGIRSRIGAARLFTFGIGPSVNRALLNRMAAWGRGRASFLQLNEDIEGAIIRFQDSVSFPALTDLTLAWEKGKAWDTYPARLPDLYYGEPLEISGRLAIKGNGPARLTLNGKRGGAPVTIHLDLPVSSGKDAAVERLWARARVDDLLDQIDLESVRADKIRAEILGLALEYNLVTQYTSFVAVDQSVTNATGQPRILHVAQPLPQGLQAAGFQGGYQPMAMMASIAPAAQIPPALTRTISDAVHGVFRKADLRQPDISSGGADKTASAAMNAASAGLLREERIQPQGEPEDREGILRWLARTQKMDGSWGGDGEWTAAALLAFVRAGYTTHSGSYRLSLRRAARWLMENPGAGLAGFLRARALEELAAATGDDAERKAAQAAHIILGQPASRLDAAALRQPVQAPPAVQTLDDLRLAGLLNLDLPVPAELLRGPQSELARTWAATLKRVILS